MGMLRNKNLCLNMVIILRVFCQSFVGPLHQGLLFFNVRPKSAYALATNFELGGVTPLSS